MPSGRRTARVRHATDPPPTHLTRLIEAEAAIEERLSTARAEAERVLAAARAAAESVAPTPRELEAGAERVRERIATDLGERLARIAAEREAEVAIWTTDPEAVRRSASAALERLLESLVPRSES